MSPLPAPDPAALEYSEKTAALIRGEIDSAGGWIPFSRFMELALYAPGLGYYSAGMHKFGAAGDFVTAPEISALFGQVLAQQAAQVIGLTAGNILEIGPGSGRLAFDLLSELEQLGQLPDRYHLLEVSADLRLRQQHLLARFAPRVEWLDTLPASFSGLIIGNEVLDAMPVHLVAWGEDGCSERGVSMQDGQFSWSERKLTSGELYDSAAGLDVAPGTLSEIGLAARGFIATLAGLLEKGVILMLDYGFGQSEYYHPQRSSGTLMCHYRHYAHDDPFYLPGLQDITSHVDFSAIAETGLAHGLNLLGYTSQAHFLINCGITDLLSRASPEQASAYLPLSSQVQKLLNPAEMGELFKAIALGKGLDTALIGFSQGDKSRML
ncbi:MAG: SAM-dependent methyltransferase [Gammaproteobacteria bacterium]|nr:SAM-dependent methyltransferase [Gammaproteobacteria bacterium]MBU1980285.1 SAM-dependent methyltransferase [Gammaproteobacteria bacterium]